MKSNLLTYYGKRAEEYEEIYYRSDPVRQKEQQRLGAKMQKVLGRKDVLEIACGTGYWTNILAKSAKKITATDYVEEVLELAKQKKYVCPVVFKREDAYKLSFAENSFKGALANFWFSHVPKKQINDFLHGFHRVLTNGATVFIADNVFVKGIGGELVTRKNQLDTYKLRILKNGQKSLILKNYYEAGELVDIFKKRSDSQAISLFYGKCFWYITYTVVT